MTHTVTVRCPYCHQDHDVEVEVNDDEDGEKYECGALLEDNRMCSRAVDSPTEQCWQHE